MKKRVLFFACLGMLFSLNLSAQTIPFSVEWVTNGTGSGSYGVQRNITGTAAGTGLETSAGAFGNLGTLELYTYSNNTNAGAVNDLASGQAWGRYRASSTAPNFSGIGGYHSAEYVQHVIEPTAGQFMRITSISMVALGGGTSDMKMIAMYSKDGINYVPMPVLANYFLPDGSPVTYQAKDVSSQILLVASNAAANTQAKRTISWTGMAINVNDGEKAYFRFYPYLGATTASTRYLFLRQTIFSGITSATTLPLQFLSFSAKPDALGKSVNLVWKTASEVNTQDFIIERRSDDTEFTEVGLVASKNVEGTHNYSYVDKKPLAGNTYYRLKQRDRDGKFTYSDVADVKITGVSLSLYPNPVSKELVVNHDYLKQPVALKVVGLDGITYIKTTSVVGTSSTTVNVASLTNGTYLLVYENNGKPQSQKFLKK